MACNGSTLKSTLIKMNFTISSGWGIFKAVKGLNVPMYVYVFYGKG